MFINILLLYIILITQKTCPKVGEIPQYDVSLLPFQVSISKRNMYFPRRGIISGLSNMVGLWSRPLVKMKSSYRKFDSESNRYLTNNETNVGNNRMKKKSPEGKNLQILPITVNMISRLGFRVLRDRQICFAGRSRRWLALLGNISTQMAIIKGFLLWYLPCIDVQEGFYKSNNGCFDRREKLFQVYLRHYFMRQYWSMYHIGYH